MAVLDRANFIEYYGNRSITDKHKACEKMFNKINLMAYDAACHDDGVEDFLRVQWPDSWHYVMQFSGIVIFSEMTRKVGFSLLVI